MRVSDHIYVYLWEDAQENNCNSILIDGKIPLLIDPGHSHRVNQLFFRMKEDGFDPKRIKVVICTHAHPDHFEGVSAFQRWTVKIGLSRAEEGLIEETGRAMYMQHGLSFPDYRIDFYLKEGTLNIGRNEFEILLTPGHSPGSICIHWSREKMLFCGDLVFMRSVGRADLPGGNVKELKRSLERISQLHVDVIVPGHGPAIVGEEEVQANFEFVNKAFFSRLA
jgi:glyoxylase-like metal-dependent hydrolase (beta-lactamase superfamily II)